MTEKEAIERLKYDLAMITFNPMTGDETPLWLLAEDEQGSYNAYECAIKALEEIQQYREIGTVEECREAREKQIPKKCIEDSCPDHTHYKCPSCGKIQKTKYDDSTFGCILNNCSNCGQALYD